jgi:hypothetical protein
MLKGRLLATTSKFASMGMFDSWMGQKSSGPSGDNTGGEMANPGGGSGGQQPQKKPATAQTGDKGTGNTNDDANDGSADDKLVQEIWNEHVDGTKSGDQKPAVDPAGNSPTSDPDKEVENYLKTNGLEPIVLTDADKEALKTGDFQSVMDRINQKILNGHMRAVSTANQLIKGQVEKAVKDAVGQSTTVLRDTKAREALQTALPWTRNTEYAPLAESVLKRFLGKTNNDIGKSVILTKIFFEKQASAMDPEAGSNRNLGGSNRQGGRSPQNSGDTNWLSMLKGNDA